MGMFDVRETALSESSEERKDLYKSFFSHSYFIFHEMAVNRNMVTEERILISSTIVSKVLTTVPTHEPAHMNGRAQLVLFPMPLCHISELAFRFVMCCYVHFE